MFDSDPAPNEEASAGQFFIHCYAPPARNRHPGGPMWKCCWGRNITSALDYLASKGMNSVYLVTCNLDGSDRKYCRMRTASNSRDRYEARKVEPWKSMFLYMERPESDSHAVTRKIESDGKRAAPANEVRVVEAVRKRGAERVAAQEGNRRGAAATAPGARREQLRPSVPKGRPAGGVLGRRERHHPALADSRRRLEFEPDPATNGSGGHGPPGSGATGGALVVLFAADARSEPRSLAVAPRRPTSRTVHPRRRGHESPYRQDPALTADCMGPAPECD